MSKKQKANAESTPKPDETTAVEIEHPTEPATDETACEAEAREDAETTACERDETIDDLRAQIAELDDRCLRQAADFDNFRRRMRREMECQSRDATVAVIEKLLPVLDSIDQAMALREQAETEEQRAYSEGIELINKQFRDVLERLGVEEIPALNEPFDPTVHQAVMHVEDDDHPDNHIVEVFQKGYAVSGRVIRHSMVKVAN